MILNVNFVLQSSYVLFLLLPQIGFARSEAHEGVARRRPAGPPERAKEESGDDHDDGIRVRRPARHDEPEHAAAGRCSGEDAERGEVVVRNALTIIVSRVGGRSRNLVRRLSSIFVLFVEL